jgi:HAD superfamily hydrolase (TIGR01490 family)
MVLQKLVFFDLDGTVSRRDTLWQWVQALLWRHPWRWPRLLAVLPALIRFALGRADHGALKASLLQAALGGLRRATIASHTARWVANFIPSGCFHDALVAIEAHRCQDDHLILMSASVDTYVPELARALGFAECICTLTAWRPDGRYDGRLAGPNCRDQEKLRQFRARLALHPGSKTWAYGNSAPDLPHLQVADRGVLINGSKALQQRAAAAGVECVNWR